MPSTVICPKCGHEQTNPVECEACGLLFHKYAQAQERRQQHDTTPAIPPPAAPMRWRLFALIGSALILMAITVGLTLYLLPNRQPATVVVPGPTAPEVTIAQPAPPSQPFPQSAQPRPLPTPEHSAGSPIEQAKNGTVAIETPWGQGSGFFITDSTVVTNKHVIQPNNEQLAEIRHKVETGRRLIELEQQKLTELRTQLNRMPDSPSRRQLTIIIQESERQLAQVLPTQQEAEARLREMDRPLTASDIKVFLADGTECTASSTQLSQSRDLALLTVYTAKAVVLRPAAHNSRLNQGDKVFTIGNPVGLRNTVTAGIFSGYRRSKENDALLLQTDAAINPGNSGGPLIDEGGRVHGINTMIIRDAQGIGFAIPIHEVFTEFSLIPSQY